MCEQRELISMEQISSLAAANQATAEQLAGLVKTLGLYIVQMDARTRKLEETLLQRVSITSAQARAFNAAIRERELALCIKYRVPHDLCGSAIRAAMKKELLQPYHITNVHDLPAAVYEDVLRAASLWDSFSLIRQLRAAHNL